MSMLAPIGTAKVVTKAITTLQKLPIKSKYPRLVVQRGLPVGNAGSDVKVKPWAGAQNTLIKVAFIPQEPGRHSVSAPL